MYRTIIAVGVALAVYCAVPCRAEALASCLLDTVIAAESRVAIGDEQAGAGLVVRPARRIE